MSKQIKRLAISQQIRFLNTYTVIITGVCTFNCQACAALLEPGQEVEMTHDQKSMDTQRHDEDLNSVPEKNLSCSVRLSRLGALVSVQDVHNRSFASVTQ